MSWTRIEKARPTVLVPKTLGPIQGSYDPLKFVAEKSLPLGCAHIGGKSTYEISWVFTTAACPTSPPSVAYALCWRDRRIRLHIVDLCAR
jgi:hypothetical protein